MISFENDNIKAYSTLLRIEIILRELIKTSYKEEFGEQWRKKLPGELLKKIKDSQKDEMKPQFGYRCLGPLYYLSFGELIVILKNNFSRSIVQNLGGDSFIKQLENLCVFRNSICHSRPVSNVGLKMIESFYAQMESALTIQEMVLLCSNHDTGITQHEVSSLLIPFLEDVLNTHKNLPPSFSIPDELVFIKNQYWWADELLAGFDPQKVETAFECIEIYNKIKCGVGCKGDRQKYITTSCLAASVENAIFELEKVRK